MTATSAPFGLEPVFHPSGNLRPIAWKDSIDVSVTQSFFRGTPVQLTTAGLIVPFSDLTWDAAADDLIGIFQGVEYTDSSGQRKLRNNWVGPITGATQIVAYVWSDPATVFRVQANGSLAQTSLGDQAQFAALDTGNTVTGISNVQISTTLVGAGNQGYVRIINIEPQIDNDWGDAFTIVQVQIAAHQFVASKVAI